MFWRGVFGYLPVQVVQGLVGFGSVYVFTRLLSPEQYGQYALAISAAALLHAGLLTWTEAAMERFHLREAERGDVPSHLATLHRAFAALAMGGLLLTVLVLAFVQVDATLKTAIAGAVAASTLRSGLRLIQQRRKAEGQVGVYAVNDMLCTAGGFAVGVLLAHAGLGPVAPSLGLAAAAALFLMIGLPRELARSAGGRFEPARARSYAAYGVPVSLSLILSVVYASTDRFLIALFLDEASVGAYHAAFGLADRTLDILFVWLGLAGAPAVIAAFEQGGEASMRSAARMQAELMVLIAFPAAVGLGMVAQPAAELMIGEELRQAAAGLIPWIAFGAVVAGFKAYYLDQSFTLARRPGLMLVSMGVTAGLNLALNLLLIPRLGLEGAVVSTTVSIVAGAAVAYGMGVRVLPLPMPWGTLLRCGGAAGAMGVAVSKLPALGGLPELLLKASAGVAVYAVLVLLIDGAHARRRALALLPSRRRLRSPIASEGDGA